MNTNMRHACTAARAFLSAFALNLCAFLSICDFFAQK